MAMPAEPQPGRPDLREVEEDIYDPVVAVANEADPAAAKKGFPFRAAGEVFRMRSPEAIGRKGAARIEAIVADENSSVLSYLNALFEVLLGPEQYARFDEVADLTNEQMTATLTAAREYYGISLPESQTSTSSSETTEQR
jgi:hypothetical protein